MRIVQIANGSQRAVAVVSEPDLKLLGEVTSVYALADRALQQGQPLTELVNSLLHGETLSYDEVFGGHSPWKLLAPVDVPDRPQMLMVSGTGLTHLGSARERQAMHAAEQPAAASDESAMTDSMRMFEWGRQKGRPAEGEIGIAPEWFYKGDGSVVRGPFEPLSIPGHAEDGGEEAEIAAIYMLDRQGMPHRIGMAVGNEFSDHVFERRNYLNLAGSKLRVCSLGPELVIGGDFADVPGTVRIVREGSVIWEKSIRTGDDNMAHSLANLEHHHFKFHGHRTPGMLHVHFLGADALSFGGDIRLKQGDIATVQFDGFGRELSNPITQDEPMRDPVRVHVML